MKHDQKGYKHDQEGYKVAKKTLTVTSIDNQSKFPKKFPKLLVLDIPKRSFISGPPHHRKSRNIKYNHFKSTKKMPKTQPKTWPFGVFSHFVMSPISTVCKFSMFQVISWLYAEIPLGLDAASPLFRNKHIREKSSKLDKSDAKFVDVVHTDASPVS